MEYIEGRPLEYYRDFQIAAELLAKVHNTLIQDADLIYAERPFQTMYDEFVTMYSVYKLWDGKNSETEKRIDRFMEIARNSGLESEIQNPCIINTELNNRNFIIGNNSKIIDWEKPIIGECEQDLAHFLVPTTTNWKTDVILSIDEMMSFLDMYEKYRHVDREKFMKYLMFNSLRGVTWCSMAKVEYSNERTLKNDETLNKINKFLSPEFLDMLSRFYEVN